MNNIEELREHCEEMMSISPLRYAYIPASSIITLIDRIEKAEAALSAANEKLKGEQVPVGFTSERALAEVYCGESSRFGPLDDVGDIPLYDRPQKPVVLSSSTVMSRAYVVQAIKAAGGKVEGNADGE